MHFNLLKKFYFIILKNTYKKKESKKGRMKFRPLSAIGWQCPFLSIFKWEKLFIKLEQQMAQKKEEEEKSSKQKKAKQRYHSNFKDLFM